MYGVSQDFITYQPLEIDEGRFLAEAEFSKGAPTAVIGYGLAEKLFGEVAAGP